MLLHRAAGVVREHNFTPKLLHCPHRMRPLTRPVLYCTSISRQTQQVWLSSSFASRGWSTRRTPDWGMLISLLKPAYARQPYRCTVVLVSERVQLFVLNRC